MKASCMVVGQKLPSATHAEIAVSSPRAHDKMYYFVNTCICPRDQHISQCCTEIIIRKTIGGNRVGFEPRFISSSTLALYPLGSWN